MYWYRRVFTPSEVHIIKDRVEEKNRLHSFNNLGSDYGTRWIGLCGELAFADYLDRIGQGYLHYYDDSKIDVQDFTVGGLEIDVKTVGRRYDPRMDWHCDVAKQQLDKTVRSGVITHFVFASYNTTTNVCHVLGTISVKKFCDIATFLAKGEMLPNNTPTPAPADFYMVPINKLRQLQYNV